MKLLRQINTLSNDVAPPVTEDAVSGGAVAGMAMPLFAVLVKRTKDAETAKKAAEVPKEEPKTKKKTLKIGETFRAMTEAAPPDMSIPDQAAGGGGQSFDTTGVIAKLKGLENRENQPKQDIVKFGLQDSDEGTVQVSVKREQAEDFERALQSFLVDDEDGQQAEIAEILFKLRDQFDIVDVEWPEVQEDEEQDQQLADGQGQEGELPPEQGMEEVPPASGGDQTQELLMQVIDMMKADAEARKAEARAREAEAKTKEANTVIAQTAERVKQEEQLLDMETYNKAKKEEEREAKKLAQLARWKHEVSRDQGIDDEPTEADIARFAGSENEELRRPASNPAPRSSKSTTIKGRVHPHDIASFILNRVK